MYPHVTMLSRVLWGKVEGNEGFHDNWKDKPTSLIRRNRQDIMLPGPSSEGPTALCSWRRAASQVCKIALAISVSLISRKRMEFIPPLSEEVRHQDTGAELGPRTALLELRRGRQLIISGTREGDSLQCTEVGAIFRGEMGVLGQSVGCALERTGNRASKPPPSREFQFLCELIRELGARLKVL